MGKLWQTVILHIWAISDIMYVRAAPSSVINGLEKFCVKSWFLKVRVLRGLLSGSELCARVYAPVHKFRTEFCLSAFKMKEPLSVCGRKSLRDHRVDSGTCGSFFLFHPSVHAS